MNLHKRDTLPGSYRARCHWYCDPLDIVKEMGFGNSRASGKSGGCRFIQGLMRAVGVRQRVSS